MDNQQIALAGRLIEVLEELVHEVRGLRANVKGVEHVIGLVCNDANGASPPGQGALTNAIHRIGEAAEGLCAAVRSATRS